MTLNLFNNIKKCKKMAYKSYFECIFMDVGWALNITLIYIVVLYVLLILVLVREYSITKTAVICLRLISACSMYVRRGCHKSLSLSHSEEVKYNINRQHAIMCLTTFIITYSCVYRPAHFINCWVFFWSKNRHRKSQIGVAEVFFVQCSSASDFFALTFCECVCLCTNVIFVCSFNFFLFLLVVKCSWLVLYISLL